MTTSKENNYILLVAEKLKEKLKGYGAKDKPLTIGVMDALLSEIIHECDKFKKYNHDN